MPPMGAAPAGVVGDYDFSWTFSVINSCLIAGSGGLLFGYDLGIAGGVSTMPHFTVKFFHDVWLKTAGPEAGTVVQSAYCKYDNQTLALFQSSLFLAAVFASFAGFPTSTKYGRRFNMYAASIAYMAGAVLNAAAVHISMLVIGRILLGVGVGLSNSSVTVYANEIAPQKWRGALNQLFQQCTTIGIIVAGIVNWADTELPWGWRLSLGLAFAPAFIMCIGTLFIPESPSSLLERGLSDQAYESLQKLRGKDIDIKPEFNAITYQTQQARDIGLSLRAAAQSCYRPYYYLSAFIAIGQQFTGINAIMFYAPVIFSTIGSGHSSALLNTVIIGAVNVLATLVAIFFVDRWGRRKFYLASGINMCILEILCGVLIAVFFGTDHGTLNKAHATGVLIVVCLYTANFAWSYGPLGWLVTSEMFPAEIRTRGMAFATSCNMFATFVIGQCFLKMMCSMKYGVFIFFGICCLIQAIALWYFLPETKGVHVEEVHNKFEAHWFWKKWPKCPRDARNIPKELEDMERAAAASRASAPTAP